MSHSPSNDVPVRIVYFDIIIQTRFNHFDIRYVERQLDVVSRRRLYDPVTGDVVGIVIRIVR